MIPGGSLPDPGPSAPQLLACELGSGEGVPQVVAVCLHLLDWEEERGQAPWWHSPSPPSKREDQGLVKTLCSSCVRETAGPGWENGPGKQVSKGGLETTGWRINRTVQEMPPGTRVSFPHGDVSPTTGSPVRAQNYGDG